MIRRLKRLFSRVDHEWPGDVVGVLMIFALFYMGLFFVGVLQ